LNFELTQEQRAFKSQIEEFARDVVAPRAASIDKSGEYPTDVMHAAAGRGLFGVTIPRAWGGAGRESITTSSASRTSQPSVHVPVHEAPSDDAHSVVGLLALIASLRATVTLACRLLATALSLLFNAASRYEGTAKARVIPRIAIANSSSTIVTPDERRRAPLEPGRYQRSPLPDVTVIASQCTSTAGSLAGYRSRVVPGDCSRAATFRYHR